MIQNEDYEIVNNIDLDIILSDLPIELIKESIKYQIYHPLYVDTDYCTIVFDKCAQVLQLYKGNEDIEKEIEELLDKFCLYVLDVLDNKYNFDIVYDNLNTYDISKITLVLYKFFILRYRKNIGEFVYNFILKNKKMLSEQFINDDKKKDVTTIVLKKKTKNKDDVRIISNLPQIIKFILDLEHDPVEFIDLSSPDDLYYADEIKSLLEDFTLSGNFTRPYLCTVVNQYNEVIDEILMEIRIKLCKNIF